MESDGAPIRSRVAACFRALGRVEQSTDILTKNKLTPRMCDQGRILGGGVTQDQGIGN